MKRPRLNYRTIGTWSGNLLTLAGVGLLISPAAPALLQELRYYLPWPDSNGLTITQFSSQSSSIHIPKIDAVAPIHLQVNPFNSREYLSKLTTGVAHAVGSALPGQPGNSYIFAHSTNTSWNLSRYNAVFYLLNKLQAGDHIHIYHQGQQLTYSVTDRRIVTANDLSVLKQDTDQKILTLQTCWPPGTTWKRLVVTAEQLNSE